MKRKIFGAMALVGLAGLSLASCQKKDNTLKITFWNTMGDNLQTVLNEAIDGFNQYFPEVKIESTQIGGYDDVKSQVVAEMSTGNYPSMAYCYDDHVAAYNEAAITYPLNDLMKDPEWGFGGSKVPFTVKESDIIEGFRTSTETFGDGNVYTLPFLRSTEVLYYNQSFFDENGLTVPTTWEDLWTVCAQIKQIDPKSTPLGYDSEANFFITLCEAYGYDYTTANSSTVAGHFLFDNAQTNEMMSKLKDYYDAGYFTTQKLYGAYTSGLFTTTNDNKCYMCVGSSAGASYQFSSAFTANIAPLPKAKNGDAAAISQGPSLVFFDKGNAEEIRYAWLFAQYLLTPEIQASFALTSGYMPVTTPATEVAAYKAKMETAGTDSKDNFATLSIKTALGQKDAYFTSDVFVGSSDARDQVGALIPTVLSDATITAANKAEKIKAHFEAAVKKCVYLAG